MKRLILIDDETHAVVPREPTPEMHAAAQECVLGRPGKVLEHAYAAMIAAAPPVPAFELPERDYIQDSTQPTYEQGWNACLDEIDRRAKE